MPATSERLLIAIPTMGSVYPQLVGRLLSWERHYPKGQIAWFFTEYVSPHDRARNQLVKFFLEQTNASHILMIDSDTIPPEDAPHRLLAHKQPIVTAMTPIQSWNKQTGEREVYDNVFESVETLEDGSPKTHIAERNTGLKPIYRCGAACLLIAREVFEKIEQPYFSFEFNEERTEVKRSEDISFCDKVKEAGFTIYADTDVQCVHHKSTYI